MNFLSESNGKLSITRLTYAVWVLGTFLVWSIGSFYNMQLLTIDNSVLTILGLIITGKVSQRYLEEKTETVSTPTPAPAPAPVPLPVPLPVPTPRPQPPMPPMPG